MNLQRFADEGDSQEGIITPSMKAIISGFKSFPKNTVDQAIEKMKSIGYEQDLQNAASKGNIDPVALMSLAVIESGGNPDKDGGLFNMSGVEKESKVVTQLEKAVEWFNQCKSDHGNGSNPICAVQAFHGWTDELSNVTDGGTDDQEFTDAWAEACGDGAYYYPAFVSVYSIIANMQTNNSTLTDSNSVVGPEFPFYTKDLDNIYYIQKYGVTNAGGANAWVSNCAVFKVPEGTNFMAAVTGTLVNVKYDESYGGNVITIREKDTNDVYAYGGIGSWTKDSEGTQVNKSDILGQTNDRFYLFYRPKDESFGDPESVWSKLRNKVSEEVSLGKQVGADNLQKGF